MKEHTNASLANALRKIIGDMCGGKYNNEITESLSKLRAQLLIKLICDFDYFKFVVNVYYK